MSTVLTVTTMSYPVPNTLNPLKLPLERSLPTPLITSLTRWTFIARNLQTILVVKDQEDGYQAIDICKTFMMQFYMTLMMGGDDDKVDESVNENDIDAGNDNKNVDVSEGDFGGDTYDDSTTD